MKPGDLVRLRGSLWSSYPREGEAGIILEFTGDDDEYVRVLWNKDAQSDICKADDLRDIKGIK